MKICLLYREGIIVPGLRKYLPAEYSVNEIVLSPDYIDQLIELEADVVVFDFANDFRLQTDLAMIRGVREVTRAPIFLALGKDVDTKYREEMFNCGVDGCIQTPFLNAELEARLSILSKKKNQLLFSETTIQAGEVQVNLRTHEVIVHNQPLKLTKTEYGILLHLMMHRSAVVSSEELNYYIRHDKGLASSAVNVHISNLRKKLGSLEIIRTIPNYGFLVSPA